MMNRQWRDDCRVRKGDEAMKTRLNAALARQRDAIHALLDAYHVPQAEGLQKTSALGR